MYMLKQFVTRHRLVFVYGFSLALLFFILKWLELRLLIMDHAFELYVGAIALLFTALGIWLAFKLVKPRVETIIVEKEVFVEQNTAAGIDEEAIVKLGISKRELEVLQGMAEGLSNQEIGERLYLSVPTIKTHAANLFEKIEVKRRTQAVDKAKKLRLIP
jgi:two-component system, NarL family, response regulator LiaR